MLSVEEVRRLIDSVRTPHNRAYFWTIYSLGLRLNEGLRLQVGDIDRERKLVHVQCGKGAKDRFVPLPGRTLEVLRDVLENPSTPALDLPRARTRRAADDRGRSADGALERAGGDAPGGAGAEVPEGGFDPHAET